MRQEAVNSFNGGLNYDLNPLTTPNSVLTDALNATFTTFNGDELMLQNDAGNTTILKFVASEYNPEVTSYSAGTYVWIIEENATVKSYFKNLTGINAGTLYDENWEFVVEPYVQLPENRRPLGIKEFGGILYIVSASTSEDESEAYSTEHNFPSGVYVYTANPSIYYRYIGPNYEYHPLPLEGSNEFWKYIGTEEEYINSRSAIYFGSYPSPEFGGVTTFDGIPYYRYEDVNGGDINTFLYNPTTINNDTYKSGRYIIFQQGTLDSTYVSRYNSSGVYIPKFYKVKLWHQLSNGFLDLTDDVWTKYKTYKGGTLSESTFWFNDSAFKYYCPNQYKGKLAISLEIEDLTTFEVEGVPELTVPDEYNYQIIVNAVGSSTIEITAVHCEIYFDGVPHTTPFINAPVTVGQAVINIGFTEPEHTNQTLTYIITPIIEVNSIDITSDLPKEFIENYKIEGSRLITSLAAFDFEIITTNNTCDTPNPYKYYNQVLLVGKNGNWIDTNFSTSGTPKVFLRFGPGITNSTIGGITPDILATYEVNNDGYPYNLILVDLTTPEEVTTLLQQTVAVKISDPTCSIVELTINIDQDINLSDITVLQDGDQLIPFSYTSTQYKYNVVPNNLIQVEILKSEFISVYDEIFISSNSSISYAMVANIYAVFEFDQNPPYTDKYWQVLWNYTTNVGSFSLLLDSFNRTLSYSGGSYSTLPIVINSGLPIITMNGSTTPLAGQFRNIPDISNYRIVNGVVVKRIYDGIE